MGKQLVLVGGGHAHMVTLANIDSFINKGHHVTVIGPSEYHYYSGMGPGVLSKIYRPEEIRFATKRVVEKKGGHFILGKVNRIDPSSKTAYLENGETQSYDILSFNAGSFVPRVTISGNENYIYAAKPIEKLVEARQKITQLLDQKSITIGVIGGGPAAVEVAGNIWRLARDHGRNRPSIRIFAGKNLMARFPEKLKRSVKTSLAKRDIKIILGGYVDKIENYKIHLTSGNKYETNFIFLASGVKPSPIFSVSNLPVGPDGGLRVNKYLQSTGFPEIFGGGDCIYFEDAPLDKVGVYAVRENPVLYHNLMASLEGGELQPFDPGKDYLQVLNMGDGTGVLHKRGFVFGGKPAFWIKDYIDVKFMKKFQSIE